MELKKQDIKDIKKDIKDTDLKAYYFVVYARNEKESLEIIQHHVFAKHGELQRGE